MLGIILIGAAVALIVKSVGNRRPDIEENEKRTEVPEMNNLPVPLDPFILQRTGLGLGGVAIPPSADAVLAHQAPELYAHIADLANYRNTISSVQQSAVEHTLAHSCIAEAIAQGRDLHVDTQYYRAGFFRRSHGIHTTVSLIRRR